MQQDHKIFIEFKSGNLEAFYRKIFPGLVHFATNLLGNNDVLLAEDSVQEAVMKTWEKKDKIPNVYGFKSFLYTSIRNNIIDIQRKNKAHGRFVRQLEDPIFFRNSIIEAEIRVLLHNAIRELPDKPRAVFEMLYLEELKISEVAHTLGLTERMIRYYRAEALNILREKLDPASYATVLAFCLRKFS